MKNNKYEIDMVNGSIMDKLISFALPLMISGILQLAFNAVDIIVVGQFSGSNHWRLLVLLRHLSMCLSICLWVYRLVRMCSLPDFMRQARMRRCLRRCTPLL